MQKSPLYFIEGMWKLVPEKDNKKFVKGKHLTWQQEEILLAVEKAVNGKAPGRITVASGHGIGKSSCLSWLVLWYLFCFKDSQVACTAPTSGQLYDVLWKELAKWINKMPDHIKLKYEWTGTHIRITESPKTWFASAKTARKEDPEALAGVHGDYVMLLADEASGVDDEVFNVAQGSLTGENTLTILTSNPTRIDGYFYETHNSDRLKDKWQRLQFNSEQSPIVKEDSDLYDIIEKHGKGSDEYKIRILGQFPDREAPDKDNFVPLLQEDEIKQVSSDEWVGFKGTKFMGIDPAGEGRDYSIWVVRDQFSAQIVAKENISDEKGVAQKTLTLMDYYGVSAENVTIDNFGIGANISREMAMARDYGNTRINAVNVGEKPDDEIYLNKRAEMGMDVKKWLRQGGELVMDKRWSELTKIRYRRELSGKMKLMSKLDMRRRGIKSPDAYDALALTFYSKGNSSLRIRNFIPTWNGYKRKGIDIPQNRMIKYK